ncbi:MAG: hypothetical protein WKF66_08915 [Pedobacter sp.]
MNSNKIIINAIRCIGMMLLICLLTSSNANAQHSASDLLRSDNWDIINTLEYRLEKNADIFPIFSEKLKTHANKEFELTGYLIPIREGLNQTRFLLSTLPINQCYYCGQNGIPAMILVEMTEGVKFTNRPIRLKGKLKLKNVNLRDYPPITLTSAVEYK